MIINQYIRRVMRQADNNRKVETYYMKQKCCVDNFE